MMATPVVLLLAFAPPRYAAEPSDEGLVRWGGLIGRAKALRSAVFADLGYVDLLMLAAAISFALVLVGGRMVRLDRRFRLVLPMFVLIAALIPTGIGQEGNLHYRMPALIACIAVAATQLRPGRFRLAAAGAVAVLALVTLARHAVLIEAWTQRDRDIAEFRQALGHIPVGARVMPVLAVQSKGPLRAPGDGELAFWHLAEFAVAERGAYSPGFFAVPGQQPVKVAERFAALSQRGFDPVRIEQLEGATTGSATPGGWQTRYDYVITIGGAPDELSSLTGPPVARGHRFGIYPILR
jgi:hypothetical protein